MAEANRKAIWVGITLLLETQRRTCVEPAPSQRENAYTARPAVRASSPELKPVYSGDAGSSVAKAEFSAKRLEQRPTAERRLLEEEADCLRPAKDQRNEASMVSTGGDQHLRRLPACALLGALALERIDKRLRQRPGERIRAAGRDSPAPETCVRSRRRSPVSEQISEPIVDYERRPGG